MLSLRSDLAIYVYNHCTGLHGNHIFTTKNHFYATQWDPAASPCMNVQSLDLHGNYPSIHELEAKYYCKLSATEVFVATQGVVA